MEHIVFDVSKVCIKYNVMIRHCGACLPTLAQQSSSRQRTVALLLVLLLQQFQICTCDSKCYVCDNYFELNVRNKDPNLQKDIRRRYCSVDSLPSEERQNDCIGKDYTGCVKIITRSYRHHIDKAGYGIRSDTTLISTVVTRDCADVPPAMGYGCHLITGSSTTSEICYCNGEYCNGAAAVGHGPTLVSLALLLALVPTIVVNYFSLYP